MKNQIIIVLMLMSLMAQAQVSIDWFNYPSGVSIATDVSNNVYTAYWDYNPAGDITLTKRNSFGNILWNATYNNTDNTKHEVATWVETDNNGDVLVSGTIRSGFSNPVNAASILMKYSPAGNLLWRVVYESSFDGSSTTKCLIDANNNIYVLGLGTGPVGQVTKIKKFNPSGVTLWNYFDTGGGAPITFKFTPDNNILVVKRGITGSINSYSKINLYGNLIWNTAGIGSLSIGDAAGDAFGNTYLINGANPGSILNKLSPTGAVIWSQTNAINGNKVEVGSDNNPVIGGYPGASYGVVFMKYDFNGNFLWQNLDADGPGLSLLAIAPMKLDVNNAAYIAGSTMSLMGVCKVNSDGTSAWAVTTSSGYPVCLDFGTDNSVYVTGGTTAKISQGPPACLPPTGMTTLNITPTQAKLKWALVPGAVQYEIWYKKTTWLNWKRKFVNGLNKSTTITNLVCNSIYEWKIRSLCDTVGVDVASAFASPVNFSTGTCRLGSDMASDDAGGLKVYPTLAFDFITVEKYLPSSISPTQLVITDITGIQVFIEKINRDNGWYKNRIDLADFKPGMYIIKLEVDHEIFISKIIKQ